MLIADHGLDVVVRPGAASGPSPARSMFLEAKSAGRSGRLRREARAAGCPMQHS